MHITFEVQSIKSIYAVLHFIHYNLYTSNMDTDEFEKLKLPYEVRRKRLWLSSKERGRLREDMLRNYNIMTIL